MNLSEILGSLKRLKGEKKLWNTTRQLPDPTMAALRPVSRKPRKLFGPVKPKQNLEP